MVCKLEKFTQGWDVRTKELVWMFDIYYVTRNYSREHA